MFLQCQSYSQSVIHFAKSTSKLFPRFYSFLFSPSTYPLQHRLPYMWWPLDPNSFRNSWSMLMPSLCSRMKINLTGTVISNPTTSAQMSVRVSLSILSDASLDRFGASNLYLGASCAILISIFFHFCSSTFQCNSVWRSSFLSKIVLQVIVWANEGLLLQFK